LILEYILKAKEIELAKKEQETPIEILEQLTLNASQPISLVEALMDPLKSHIIAEFKRKTNNKELISASESAINWTSRFINGHAVAVSFKMDNALYGGTSDDLYQSKQLFPDTPMIYDDIIIDPYQIVEARALGADAICLYSSLLDVENVNAFIQLAHLLDMEVIMCIKDREDIIKFSDVTDIVCIINSNFDGTDGDIQQSIDLYHLIPQDKIKISAGGIHTQNHINTLLDIGYDGVILGTILVPSN